MRFSFGNSSTERFPEKSSMNTSRLVKVVFFKNFKFLVYTIWQTVMTVAILAKVAQN